MRVFPNTILASCCMPVSIQCYGFLGIHVSQLHKQHAMWQLDLCQVGAPFRFLFERQQ